MNPLIQTLGSPPPLGAAEFGPTDGLTPAARAGGTWILYGRSDAAEPMRKFPVHSSPLKIGRSAACGLQLNCPAVSAVHAEFIDQGPTALLRDLGSTNGTFVNGVRLASAIELASGDLIQFGSQAFRVVKQKLSAGRATLRENVCDHALTLIAFDRLASEQLVIPFYQPIVDLRTQAIVGVEVLCRSAVPGLETPFQMFSAAALLDQEASFSESIRWKACQETKAVATVPNLFLNTHPVELRQPGLLESLKRLRTETPIQPLTLEIHEAAVTDAPQMTRLGEELRAINVRLAFDDFGAGQARILELIAVRPDYLKFDMSLIRNIDRAASDHRQMVADLVKLARNLGILVLAEGVEYEAEAATCVALDFDLAQGFYFGRPAPLKSLLDLR